MRAAQCRAGGRHRDFAGTCIPAIEIARIADTATTLDDTFDRIDLIGDPFANVPAAPSTTSVRWVNRDAFKTAAAGTTGNLGRNAVNGPGFFTIDPSLFKSAGVHIHVPAGAIPKDGPSAGVTMATALTSLYTKLPARSVVEEAMSIAGKICIYTNENISYEELG